MRILGLIGLCGKSIGLTLGALMLLPIIAFSGMVLRMMGMHALLYDLGLFCEVIQDGIENVVLKLQHEINLLEAEEAERHGKE